MQGTGDGSSRLQSASLRKKKQDGGNWEHTKARGRKTQGTDLFLLAEKAGVDTCIGQRSAWPRARPQTRANAGVGRPPETCSRTCAGAALRPSRARGRQRSP